MEHNHTLTRSIQSDLVAAGISLKSGTLTKLQRIQNKIIQKEQSKTTRSRKGLTVCFSGNSPNDKSSAATLIAKRLESEIYRVDLSVVVSKYIGETEKNLDALFRDAESKNWILFFDEADALFGKRTEVKDAHDKYANQEVSYISKKLKTYTGLAIISVINKQNIDEAFQRRLNYIVEFPAPKAPKSRKKSRKIGQEE